MLRLVATVSGHMACSAAVQAGADALILTGKSSDSAFGCIGVPTVESVTSAVESVAGTGVGIRVYAAGRYPGSRFPEMIELAASWAESGISAVTVDDPGLAVALMDELPDVDVFAGPSARALNRESVAFLASAGFAGLTAGFGTDPAVFASGPRANGFKVEKVVFGPACPSLEGLCILSGYLGMESCDCRSGDIEACHRRIFRVGFGGEGTLPAVGFCNGISAIGLLEKIGVDAVVVDMAGRSSCAVRRAVRTFRRAVDRAIAEESTGRSYFVSPEWLADLGFAALYRQSAESPSRDPGCANAAAAVSLKGILAGVIDRVLFEHECAPQALPKR